MTAPRLPTGWTQEEFEELIAIQEKARREKKRKSTCHCGGEGCPCCDGAGGFSKEPERKP